MIELINVTKIYKNNKILNDISVTFDRNLHIIYGNNGSGKSTLLKILSSIIYKTSGSILTTGSCTGGSSSKTSSTFFCHFLYASR